MDNSKIDKLKFLLEKNKFSEPEWEKRGLNPSDSELCELMENKFNLCLNSLIIHIENDSKKRKLKDELCKGLKSFNKSNFDTEEREFICDYFSDISKILNVDFKNELNNWLYGSILSSLFRIISFFRGNEKIIETLSQDCTKCQSKLETFIFQKDETVPDSIFFIVKCLACGEFNLLDNGPHLKRFKFGYYELTEQLPKESYDLEGAKIRLKQLQFFRK